MVKVHMHEELTEHTSNKILPFGSQNLKISSSKMVYLALVFGSFRSNHSHVNPILSFPPIRRIIYTTITMNLLMLSWAAAYLPDPYHQALLCCGGSKGYTAFKRSLRPGYPAHTILATNVDVFEDMGTATSEEDGDGGGGKAPPTPRHPYSLIYRVDPLLRRRRQGDRGWGFQQDIVRIQIPPPRITNHNNSTILTTTGPTPNTIDDDESTTHHHLSLIGNVQHLPPRVPL